MRERDKENKDIKMPHIDHKNFDKLHDNSNQLKPEFKNRLNGNSYRTPNAIVKNRFKLDAINSSRMYASRYAGQFPKVDEDQSLNLRGSLIQQNDTSVRFNKFDMTGYMPKGMGAKKDDSNKLPMLKGMHNYNDE